MKDLLRIYLALLLTPAHLLADENINAKDESDEGEVEEDEESSEEEVEEVEEVVEDSIKEEDEIPVISFHYLQMI